MGSMALIKQFYHDAKWYAAGGSKTKDISLEVFNQNKSLVQIFNAGDKLNILRADKIGDEFGINYLIKGLVKANGKMIQPGQIFIYEPYEIAECEFLEETEILVVKTPCVAGDKYENNKNVLYLFVTEYCP